MAKRNLLVKDQCGGAVKIGIRLHIWRDEETQKRGYYEASYNDSGIHTTVKFTHGDPSVDPVGLPKTAKYLGTIPVDAVVYPQYNVEE